MKYEIPLESVPNQELSTALNDHDVDIVLTTAYELLLMNVTIDGVLACAGVKCISGVSMLPSDAEALLGGRLYFETLAGVYPSMDNISTDDCKLIFEVK